MTHAVCVTLFSALLSFELEATLKGVSGFESSRQSRFYLNPRESDEKKQKDLDKEIEKMVHKVFESSKKTDLNKEIEEGVIKEMKNRSRQKNL